KSSAEQLFRNCTFTVSGGGLRIIGIAHHPTDRCQMPPVLPTERIAHLGTVDCCIHPPERYDTIGSRRRKFFPKGGNPKIGHLLPRQQPPSPETISKQISGEGAWINFRFSLALPQGPLGNGTPSVIGRVG